MRRSAYNPERKFFDDLLGDNLDKGIARIESNRPTIWLVDGSLGDGKTSLAVQIADYISEKHGKPWIDFEKQLARNGHEFLSKFNECVKNKFPVMIYDEAGDFSGSGFMTRFNKAINSILDKHRVFKIFIIIAIPVSKDIAMPIVNKGCVRSILHIEKRIDESGFIKMSGWSLHRFSYLRRDFDKYKYSPKSAYRFNQPNYHARAYDVWPMDRRLALRNYSIAGKKKDALLAEVMLHGYQSMKDLIEKTGLSKPTILKYMKKKGMKAMMKVGMTNYYSEALVEYLKKGRY